MGIPGACKYILSAGASSFVDDLETLRDGGNVVTLLLDASNWAIQTLARECSLHDFTFAPPVWRLQRIAAEFTSQVQQAGLRIVWVLDGPIPCMSNIPSDEEMHLLKKRWTIPLLSEAEREAFGFWNDQDMTMFWDVYRCAGAHHAMLDVFAPLRNANTRVVMAPGEADNELIRLCRADTSAYIVTNDSDPFFYAGTRVILADTLHFDATHGRYSAVIIHSPLASLRVALAADLGWDRGEEDLDLAAVSLMPFAATLYDASLGETWKYLHKRMPPPPPTMTTVHENAACCALRIAISRPLKSAFDVYNEFRDILVEVVAENDNTLLQILYAECFAAVLNWSTDVIVQISKLVDSQTRASIPANVEVCRSFVLHVLASKLEKECAAHPNTQISPRTRWKEAREILAQFSCGIAVLSFHKPHCNAQPHESVLDKNGTENPFVTLARVAHEWFKAIGGQQNMDRIVHIINFDSIYPLVKRISESTDPPFPELAEDWSMHQRSRYIWVAIMSERSAIRIMRPGNNPFLTCPRLGLLFILLDIVSRVIRKNLVPDEDQAERERIVRFLAAKRLAKQSREDFPNTSEDFLQKILAEKTLITDAQIVAFDPHKEFVRLIRVHRVSIETIQVSAIRYLCPHFIHPCLVALALRDVLPPSFRFIVAHKKEDSEVMRWLPRVNEMIGVISLLCEMLCLGHIDNSRAFLDWSSVLAVHRLLQAESWPEFLTRTPPGFKERYHNLWLESKNALPSEFALPGISELVPHDPNEEDWERAVPALLGRRLQHVDEDAATPRPTTVISACDAIKIDCIFIRRHVNGKALLRRVGDTTAERLFMYADYGQWKWHDHVEAFFERETLSLVWARNVFSPRFEGEIIRNDGSKAHVSIRGIPGIRSDLGLTERDCLSIFASKAVIVRLVRGTRVRFRILCSMKGPPIACDVEILYVAPVVEGLLRWRRGKVVREVKVNVGDDSD